MNEEKRPFLVFITYLQILGIILVVFGHSFHEYPDGCYGYSLTVYWLLYSFRMPLFIFVSGFLLYFTNFTSGRKRKWRHFTLNKLKRLLIPYLVLEAVTFFPRARMSGMADDIVPLNIRSFTESLFFSDQLVIPYFWFIQLSLLLLVTVYGYLIVADRLNIPRGTTMIVLILFLFSLRYWPVTFPSFWALDRLPLLGLYFGLGVCYAAFHEVIDAHIRWTSPAVALLLPIVWLILFFTVYYTEWSWLCSIFGIAMCISLTKLMVRHNIGIFNHLIGANYIIFLLSWYLNVGCQQMLHHYTDFPWWVYTLLSLFAGIYVPWLAYRLMLRHPHRRHTRAIAFLLGQSLRQRPK